MICDSITNTSLKFWSTYNLYNDFNNAHIYPPSPVATTVRDHNYKDNDDNGVKIVSE